MSNSDVMTLLARENPVSEHELDGPDGPDAVRLRATVLARAAEIAEATATPRRLPQVAFATAALAIGALVVATQFLPGKRTGASDAAAAVLNEAAAAATAYAGSREGRFAYTRAEVREAALASDEPPFAVVIRRTRETWVAADGSGRMRESAGQLHFPGPRDRERWQAAGAPRFGRAPTERRLRPAPPAVSASPPPTDLDGLDRLLNAPSRLPTDPDRLEHIVRAYAQHRDPPLEAAMFVQLGDLLTNPQSSAELRAASYRVLARIGGVESRGRTQDRLGRAGVAITAPAGYSSDVRTEMVIVPDTGEVLAYETVFVRRVDWADAAPGDVLSSVVYVGHGWVDSTRERPAR